MESDEQLLTDAAAAIQAVLYHAIKGYEDRMLFISHTMGGNHALNTLAKLKCRIPDLSIVETFQEEVQKRMTQL